jgi:hypothetical protein
LITAGGQMLGTSCQPPKPLFPELDTGGNQILQTPKQIKKTRSGMNV